MNPLTLVLPIDCAPGEEISIWRRHPLVERLIILVGDKNQIGIRYPETIGVDSLFSGKVINQILDRWASDYLLLNFDVRAYVGVGDYGHIAPVGAYDAERQRVLVLDPDRVWYEPYWIPESVALAGMATRDSVTGRPRGYIHVALH